MRPAGTRRKAQSIVRCTVNRMRLHFLTAPKMRMMDRRTALQRLGLLAGASISASTVAAVLGGCQAAPDPDYVPITVSKAHFQYLNVVSDIILPRSDTPGATDVGVPVFMDTLLTEYVLQNDRQAFMAGLETMMATFPRMTLVQATELDRRAFSHPFPDDSEAHTWRRLKEWTVVGYYTSSEGATNELKTMPLGVFKADIGTQTTWA